MRCCFTAVAALKSQMSSGNSGAEAAAAPAAASFSSRERADDGSGSRLDDEAHDADMGVDGVAEVAAGAPQAAAADAGAPSARPPRARKTPLDTFMESSKVTL